MRDHNPARQLQPDPRPVYLIEINVLQFPFHGGRPGVSLLRGSTAACFIRHKAFMSHSCRRSHCCFTGRGQQGESHGEEKEEELKIEDLRRAGLEVTL